MWVELQIPEIHDSRVTYRHFWLFIVPVFFLYRCRYFFYKLSGRSRSDPIKKRVRIRPTDCNIRVTCSIIWFTREKNRSEVPVPEAVPVLYQRFRCRYRYSVLLDTRFIPVPVFFFYKLSGRSRSDPIKKRMRIRPTDCNIHVTCSIIWLTREKNRSEVPVPEAVLVLYQRFRCRYRYSVNNSGMILQVVFNCRWPVRCPSWWTMPS
jgi:hypothetical protein